ncbi:MAG: OmpA family protein [Treponema sp.]|jgi:outer membrane protein OmpA-like peptidoglycan-associated protein|nr:OmpA family protein [Treponema sp.]
MVKKRYSAFLIFYILIYTVFSPIKAAGEVFEYKHVPGEQYRILSIVDEAVYVNGILSHRAEILNRIAVEVKDVKDGIGQHSAVFQTSERLIYDFFLGAQTALTGFEWSREYESEFKRDRLGNLTIDSRFYMPVVRNVPTFPGRELAVGDKWFAPGHEVHDFRDAFGISEPYEISFNAFYEYLGEREWKEVSYPAFSVNYNIESRPSPVRGRLYPVRISGTFSQLVFWDRGIGKEAAYEETFRIIFTMSDGTRYEFRGTAQAELVESEQMNKEQLITDIIEEIAKLEIPDVVVKAVEEGISLSLENIQFYPDTNVMLPGEQAKLDIIAEILLRYPGRDILVSGHAAPLGSRDYLMKLSQDRARAVADFLLSKNVRTPDRIVTRGYGADRPIADNSTEEGMQRNRRVEITILEN